jgi:hypothetical protein
MDKRKFFNTLGWFLGGLYGFAFITLLFSYLISDPIKTEEWYMDFTFILFAIGVSLVRATSNKT